MVILAIIILSEYQKAIFQADKEKQKEFLRGYFDVTGYVRASNSQFGKEDQQRIYLEVDHRNWFLTFRFI